MDWFSELWVQGKQAGPFAVLFLLIACYFLNSERKAERERVEVERKKYDAIVARFVALASDVSTTVDQWRKVFSRQDVPNG